MTVSSLHLVVRTLMEYKAYGCVPHTTIYQTHASKHKTNHACA